MQYVWIVSAIDLIENDENSIFGAYSTEDKAMAAILYWIFENGDETAEHFHEDDIYAEYITDKHIWRIEKVEVDFLI